MAANARRDMVRASVVASRFGIDARTVKRAIESKQIPGLVVGSLYLVNATWLASVTSWPQVTS